MADPLFHVGAQAQCQHFGTVTTTSPNVRVMVSGMAVARVEDQSVIAGCGNSSQPCVRVKWFPSARVRVLGSPVVFGSMNGGSCVAGEVDMGPPKILVVQNRVKGT